MTPGEREPSHRPAAPLDRAERAALAALGDQLDRESPTLASELRGPARALTSRRPSRGRGVLYGVLLALALLGVTVGVAASVIVAGMVWGLAGLVASTVALVAVLAAMTLRAALAP